MSELERIKLSIIEHKQELKERFHIREIGLFGSYVRGENRPDSDLDVLVDFEQAPGLFVFARIKNYLTSLTGVPVDLVMRRALKPYLGKNILKETVYL